MTRGANNINSHLLKGARETTSPVIPPDARKNACLQKHFDEAAHEREARISEAEESLGKGQNANAGRSLTYVRDDGLGADGMTGWGRTG